MFKKEEETKPASFLADQEDINIWSPNLFLFTCLFATQWKNYNAFNVAFQSKLLFVKLNSRLLSWNFSWIYGPFTSQRACCYIKRTSHNKCNLYTMLLSSKCCKDHKIKNYIKRKFYQILYNLFFYKYALFLRINSKIVQCPGSLFCGCYWNYLNFTFPNCCCFGW